MVLDTSLFNTQHYEVWIKGKWSNSRKGVVPSPTPWCSSYWKGSHCVILHYGWPTYIKSYLQTITIVSAVLTELSSIVSFWIRKYFYVTFLALENDLFRFFWLFEIPWSFISIKVYFLCDFLKKFLCVHGCLYMT